MAPVTEHSGSMWFYLDNAGQEFGPFSGETMRTWFTEGVFPTKQDLCIRLPDWDHHVPVRVVFPEMHDAFLWPGCQLLGKPVSHRRSFVSSTSSNRLDLRVNGLVHQSKEWLAQGPLDCRFNGHIKSYNAKQGFGFIECPEIAAVFGRDVFLHKAQFGDRKVGVEVTFKVEPNKHGMPQARDLESVGFRSEPALFNSSRAKKKSNGLERK